MNQLRFLSFNLAVCVTNFHFFFLNMGLYIGAKFFRSETPYDIP